MANSSVLVNDNWCIPWTTPVYLYGLVIPGIALFIFGLTFNPIALYYFATSRHFRRSAYSYYFSAIAVVDLVRLTIWFLFLLLDFQIFKLHFYTYECSIQVFSESITSSISAWLTVALAVERCLVIYRPFQTLTDPKGKRALIVIFCVILASCAVNSLVLYPGFYKERAYKKETQSIICFYVEDSAEPNRTSKLTPDIKRNYLLSIVIIRVVIPFMLLLTANIKLLDILRRTVKQASNSQQICLVRHGTHRQITPMIIFSSCFLLLTVSPRYLLQFYVNFVHPYINCPLIHFAPHLLKTLELFNYSFNVFISIVSGKHGRHELFNMLLCRTKNFYTTPISYTAGFNRSPYPPRSNQKFQEPIMTTNKPLLENNYS